MSHSDDQPPVNPFASTQAVENVASGGRTERAYSIPKTMKQDRKEFLLNGRYRVLNKLGSGGFASVYRGIDENLKRPVAIKIMRSDLLDGAHRESFLKRFRREAFTVANFDHPHLTPVYETGIVDQDDQELAFIVMKRLVGHDLEELVEGGHEIDAPFIMSVMSQVLDALSYVHSKGVIHKDLKPSNIFVTEDHAGRPFAYLMDFGIAHDQRDDRGRLTKTGVVTGTTQYLPPEYMLENSATPRLDVFQMGMILAELITGRPVNPNDITMPLLVARYLRKEEYELEPWLATSGVGRLVARTLALDPAARPADAGAFLREFKKLTATDFPSPVDVTEPTAAALSPSTADLARALTDSNPMISSPTTSPGIDDPTQVYDPRPTTEPNSAPPPSNASASFDEWDRRSSGEVTAEPPASASSSLVAYDDPSQSTSSVHQVLDQLNGSEDYKRLFVLIGIAILLCVGLIVELLQPKESVQLGSAVTSPDTHPTDTETPDTSTSQPVEKITIRVESTPPGAHIMWDGEESGLTPTTLEHPKAANPSQLTLALDGFVSQTVPVELIEDQVIEMTLVEEATPSKPPAERRTERKKTSRREPTPRTAKDTPKDAPTKTAPRVAEKPPAAPRKPTGPKRTRILLPPRN